MTFFPWPVVLLAWTVSQAAAFSLCPTAAPTAAPTALGMRPAVAGCHAVGLRRGGLCMSGMSYVGLFRSKGYRVHLARMPVVGQPLRRTGFSLMMAQVFFFFFITLEPRVE